MKRSLPVFLRKHFPPIRPALKTLRKEALPHSKAFLQNLREAPPPESRNALPIPPRLVPLPFPDKRKMRRKSFLPLPAQSFAAPKDLLRGFFPAADSFLLRKAAPPASPSAFQFPAKSFQASPERLRFHRKNTALTAEPLLWLGPCGRPDTPPPENPHNRRSLWKSLSW